MTTLRRARRALPSIALPGGRRAAHMPSFDPREYPNLVAFVDFADTSKLTDAGSGAVSQVISKDPGAKVFSQATGGNRPTMNTRTLNGRHVVDFDGSDLLTYLSNISLSANNGAATFYVVGQADTLSTYRSLWTADKSTGGGDRLTQGPRSATTTETTFSWFNTNATIFGVGDATGMASLVTSPFLITDVFGGTVAKTLDVYRDTTHVGSQATSAATPRTASANWGIGGVDLSDLTHGWDGIIAEFLVYNEDHVATGKKATVETYLRRKWNLP